MGPEPQSQRPRVWCARPEVSVRIRDIMTRNPVCCSATATPQAAASLMRQWDTGVLPVVEDLFSHRVVGIITDRDLCLALLPAAAIPPVAWLSNS